MIEDAVLTKEGLLKIVNDFYQSYVVFLIDDSSGVLTNQSTMVDAAPLEIDELNQYSRLAVTIDPFSFSLNKVSSVTEKKIWQISGGNITFTHVCFAVGANLINKDTTGTLERIVGSSSGTPLTINDNGIYVVDQFQILLEGSFS